MSSHVTVVADNKVLRRCHNSSCDTARCVGVARWRRDYTPQIMGTTTQKQSIALVQRVSKWAAGVETLSQSQSLDSDTVLFSSVGWNISASSLGAKTSFWLFCMWNDPLFWEEQWSLKNFNWSCCAYLIEPLLKWKKYGLNINPAGLN